MGMLIDSLAAMKATSEERMAKFGTPGKSTPAGWAGNQPMRNTAQMQPVMAPTAAGKRPTDMTAAPARMPGPLRMGEEGFMAQQLFGAPGSRGMRGSGNR